MDVVGVVGWGDVVFLCLLLGVFVADDGEAGVVVMVFVLVVVFVSVVVR
ncbi:MAG: hypothetical protein LBJ43_03935 [Propionibacteriaceae bacterium]|nr:hypothetical protein [Propionibacteriaceae bacterium]